MEHRRRIYISNDSYPELRNLPRGWERHKAWWRAFRCAVRRSEFWYFLLPTIGLALSFVALGLGVSVRFKSPIFMVAGWSTVMGAVAFWGWRTITVGGDMIRPFLRRTTDLCGESCPNCGYHLRGQLLGEAVSFPIRCPECGVEFGRESFEEPFLVCV